MYDSLTLSAVLKELRETILGRRVSKVHQPDDLTLVLHFPGLASRRLLMSADPTGPRVHLISKAPPNPPAPPEFCAALRRHLEGAILSGISQPDFDRVARFAFERGDDQRTLIAELMGRHSNIILVDSSGKIIAAAKTVGKRQSRVRPILPGGKYLPLPPQGKLDPLKVTPAAIQGLLERLPGDETAAEFLKGRFFGFHAKMAANALSDSGIEPGQKLSELKRQPDPLIHLLGKLVEIVVKARYDPLVVEGESGAILDFGAHPWCVDRTAGTIRGVDSANSAVEAFFAQKGVESEVERARLGLGKLISVEVKKLERALERVVRDIEDSRDHEGTKRLGDLLLANLAKVAKGARSVRLPDLYSDGQPELEIELDPRLDAHENAKVYFSRARKARLRLAKSQERLRQVEANLGSLRAVSEALQAARSVEEIDSVRASAVELRIRDAQLRPERREELARERDELSKAGIRRLEFSGYEILYGRTATANDYLTTKVAAKEDYWLHTRGCRSAHVVIRTRGKPDRVPREVLVEAAMVAARTSDAKHSSLVPVDYTLAKYVRKPRRSKPGVAACEREKTITVRPDGGK